MGDKRTTYLETQTWARLDRVAQDHDLHPATRHREIRRGSAAAVIEAIIQDYDRIYAELEKCRAENVTLKNKLAHVDQARAQAKQGAAQVRTMQADFNLLAEVLQDRLNGIAGMDLTCIAPPKPDKPLSEMTDAEWDQLERQATLPLPDVKSGPAQVPPLPTIDHRTELTNRLAVLQNALNYGRHANGDKLLPQHRAAYLAEKRRIEAALEGK